MKAGILISFGVRCLTLSVLGGVSPASLPFYFLEPTDLSAASNVTFQVSSVADQTPTPVLWATPKDKPHCYYVPVSSEERADAVRIWYQRIDSTENEQVNQRVLCVGEIKKGRFLTPKLGNSLSPWPNERNVILRRSPFRSSWGGFNVHQILGCAKGQEHVAPYSMIYWDQPSKGDAGGLLAVSQDGIDWQTSTESGALFTEHNDAFTLIWNAAAREYWLYQTKLEDWPDKPYPDNLKKWRRVISLRRSRDLKSWGPQEVILRPDNHDPKAREFYLLKVFNYGFRFAGLLMRYEADPDRPNQHGTHTTTELILSDDGLSWRRPFRDVDLGFWSYADGFHQNGKLCFMTGGLSGLRLLHLDGLVACGTPTQSGTAFGQSGIIVTHSFRFPESGLALDFDASKGVLNAEVLDEQGKPFPGFAADQCRFESVKGAKVPLTWGNEKTSRLNDHLVHLRLILRGARVYALLHNRSSL